MTKQFLEEIRELLLELAQAEAAGVRLAAEAARTEVARRARVVEKEKEEKEWLAQQEAHELDVLTRALAASVQSNSSPHRDGTAGKVSPRAQSSAAKTEVQPAVRHALASTSSARAHGLPSAQHAKQPTPQHAASQGAQQTPRQAQSGQSGPPTPQQPQLRAQPQAVPGQRQDKAVRQQALLERTRHDAMTGVEAALARAKEARARQSAALEADTARRQAVEEAAARQRAATEEAAAEEVELFWQQAAVAGVAARAAARQQALASDLVGSGLPPVTPRSTVRSGRGGRGGRGAACGMSQMPQQSPQSLQSQSSPATLLASAPLPRPEQALFAPLPTHSGQNFAYEKLAAAAGGWSEACCLGSGGSGSVYRAVLGSGTPVAVKRFTLHSEDLSAGSDVRSSQSAGGKGSKGGEGSEGSEGSEGGKGGKGSNGSKGIKAFFLLAYSRPL